ncbi:MAG TPA: L-aspartate oxidase [Bacteroidales bacterium]|nr:L-aspartate oxidase [Bacteroidales bacterium]
MRRYIFQKELEEIPVANFDVIIIGGGLSGLYAAAILNERLSVGVIVKNTLPECNSWLAQGGIAVAAGHDDSPEQHLNDTVNAAGGLVNVQALRLMVEGGHDELLTLSALGVKFDTDQSGHWLAACEGAHSRRRIVRCGGDATGQSIMDRLFTLVRSKPNIKVFENHFLTDILTDDHNQVAGIITFSESFKFFSAPCVVLATGGAGGLYRFTTNSPNITGDGIAAALRAGVKTERLEFIQFHPTAFYLPRPDGSCFLISESVRGEGGILRNHLGHPFMQNRHPMGDLAPRDIVAREIFREMKASRHDHIFLDITSKPAGFIKKRFPTIYEYCRQHGILMEKDLIPVMPAQHYLIGGIKTDNYGNTSLAGLYACGETASTGVHGANRLAGNSLLECLFFASQVAKAIEGSHLARKKAIIKDLGANVGFAGDVNALKQNLRVIMQTCGGILRTTHGLNKGIEWLNNLIDSVEPAKLSNINQFELLNMALTGREILQSALSRKEKIGTHYIED